VLLIGIYAKRSSRPLTLSVVQFGICAILGIIGALMLEPVSWSMIRGALPEMLFAGIFSSGLAFSLQAIGQRHTTPAQAAVFLSSESLFAAFFGALLLGERISGIGYLGCLLIFAAILAVEIIPAASVKHVSTAN
jgi:drug/metabolite transporter (DMT)-like permease